MSAKPNIFLQKTTIGSPLHIVENVNRKKSLMIRLVFLIVPYTVHLTSARSNKHPDIHTYEKAVTAITPPFWTRHSLCFIICFVNLHFFEMSTNSYHVIPTFVSSNPFTTKRGVAHCPAPFDVSYLWIMTSHCFFVCLNI